MESQVYSIPRSAARSIVRGDGAHPGLAGVVLFLPYGWGTLVRARFSGLPAGVFLGFHIHEKGVCTANGDVSFLSAGGHYDPRGVPHPLHAGDLPPLLSSADGTAMMEAYSDRFTPEEVVGRAVVVHGMADDFRSQPAGDSGMRIACGVIERL